MVRFLKPLLTYLDLMVFFLIFLFFLVSSLFCFYQLYQMYPGEVTYITGYGVLVSSEIIDLVVYNFFAGMAGLGYLIIKVPLNIYSGRKKSD